MKTRIKAESGHQDLTITREFDLPLELLFKAYIDPELFSQWMGTRVLKMECHQHGGYRFETSDDKGKVVVSANGVFHEIVADTRIIRTFEMEGTPFPVQLEFLEFEKLTEETSILHMHIVYRSGEHRDRMLKLPFAQGLNMAHNRLQEIMRKVK